MATAAVSGEKSKTRSRESNTLPYLETHLIFDGGEPHSFAAFESVGWNVAP